ncbi:hypothetical protein gvb04_01610 [Gardnerella vaginalis]|uniref:hypothetical protein n=1 Tax=Gardnerella vaginalis TaxID=2702 RepID=UPI000E218E01|nr:hypothetical protein [Gardnerella vaginalis]RDW98319.1 hypothetical protein gvb04_01610 [Gardnerella vaginalis]
MQRPTKRARFMRGVVAPIFGLLAALSIVLGVLNATVWKPSSIVSAHANVYGSRYIVTDPGVLNLVDYRVKISVAALNSRKPICVAVGLAKDVRGWTKGYSVQRITGLNNWNSLSTDVMQADDGARIDSTKTDDSKVSKDAAKDVDFKDSDLWTNATCQMGLAKLSINAADFEQAGNAADLALKQESQERSQEQNNAQSNSKNGAQSQTSRQKLSSELQSKIARRVLIIDLGKNSPEAFVELRWRRHNLPDFATPMYFVGALFILLCGLSASVFAMAPHRRRNKRLVASRTGLISVENNSQEEVKFSEALAGTIAGIFGSHKGKKSKRKVGSGAHARHGVHARTRTTKSKAAVDSSISVKSGLNSSKTAALDETTVISKDDLQAYFARLASESSSDFKGDFASGNKESETFDLSSANQSEQSEDLREAAESAESSESSKFRNSGIAGKPGKSQKSQKSESASKSESGFAKKRYKKESYKDRNDRNNRKENSAGGSKKANRGERKNRYGRMDAEYYKDDDGRKSDNRIGENLGKSSEAFDSTSAKPGEAKPGEAKRKSRNQFNQRDYRSQNRGKNRKYKGSENRTSGSASGGNTNGNKDGNKASNNANHDANGFNNASHQNASRQNGSQNGSSKPSKNRKK